jgi:hypothetical protein
LDQKLPFTYFLASIKNVQVTEEAFSSQKRPSNTSKEELLNIFSTFVSHFCPLGSGSATLDEGSFVVLAVSPEERSELQLEEPHTELADRYVDSHLGSEKGCTEKSRERVFSDFLWSYLYL